MLLLILADGMDLTGAMPGISSIASIGFAVWYAWYCTSIAIPAMQKQHREERDKANERFTATIDKLVTELNATREAYWNGKRDQHRAGG